MSLSIRKFENIKLGISIDTYIDDKQNIWFKGIDVARVLKYVDTDKAIRIHIDEEDKKTYPAVLAGQVRHSICVRV